MAQIDVTMQGVGRQFAKMAGEIEAHLMEKQMLIEKIQELEEAAKEPAKEVKKK